jgi:hypothetical protein
MVCVQNLIKRLFPDKIITHHISDLNDLLLNKTDGICKSIGKQNKSLQLCSLTIEQLIILKNTAVNPVIP